MKILMKAVAGSHLFGLNTPSSDKDYKGIFLPSAEEILLQRVPKTRNTTTGQKDAKNTAEDIDVELYSLGKFFEMLSTQPGKVSYGEKEVMEQLKMGTVDVLLLSEALPDEKIEEFEKQAEALGTDVNIISTETREGVQLRDIGKVAALLRYEVQ